MRWRLIRSPAQPGAMNMAIDEAMLLVHAAGKTPPTLRLYAWSPPAVSLGLLQPVHVVDETLCRTLGYDLVRRPSGGGAVLHEHEVTYAVVMDGALCPDGSSVMATYRWLSGGLIAALQSLGITASSGSSVAPKPKNRNLKLAPFCFVRLTDADLEVSGRKLGGSAQARRRRFLLQHGSIPLRFEREALKQLFGAPINERFTCVEWLLSRPVSPEEFADALVQGFSEALGITFIPDDLTPLERSLTELLTQHKYGTEAWTKERKVAVELQAMVGRMTRDEG